MKLLAEVNQDDTFNRLMSKIQTAIGGMPENKKKGKEGLLEHALEYDSTGKNGIRPVPSQRSALDQAITDLQKVRAMMFNL